MPEVTRGYYHISDSKVVWANGLEGMFPLTQTPRRKGPEANLSEVSQLRAGTPYPGTPKALNPKPLIIPPLHTP